MIDRLEFDEMLTKILILLIIFISYKNFLLFVFIIFYTLYVLMFIYFLFIQIFIIFCFEAKGGEHDIYSFPAERENTRKVRKIDFEGKNLYFYAFFA